MLENCEFKFDLDVIDIVYIEPDVENKLIYAAFKICFKFLHPTATQKEEINDFILRNLKINMDPLAS